MKKVLLILSFILITFSAASARVYALDGCDLGPEFCFEDPGEGGGGTYVAPDYYLVDTGLVGTVVKSDGYLIGLYHIFVRANEIAVDLNTSDLFFRTDPNYGDFYTSEYVIQRDTSAGLTDGGSYWVQQGMDEALFEAYSYYAAGLKVTGYTVLLKADWSGRLYLNYGLSNQTYRVMLYGYYNTAEDVFMVSENNGMSGSFGKFVYAKRVTSTTYSDYHVIGWALLNISGYLKVYAYTSYTSYLAVPTNYNITDFVNIIFVNM